MYHPNTIRIDFFKLHHFRKADNKRPKEEKKMLLQKSPQQRSQQKWKNDGKITMFYRLKISKLFYSELFAAEQTKNEPESASRCQSKIKL